ncbi:uncharacterized protein STEHIDRAFT_132884 [Stereum hirsutum FP-91666 SS1]|uniref:uncharacterized protein n=1 Tax=Stereum hirsutum (strain FP-91666) TaxID=721885 RepID=UPI000444A138|nr:uncharacterized protein STEHIDRAFT_132884 [Stereum hirsutum FP-91666 SS1]EIM83726.1 hypothetical protein STEHIDRAFT_132884 [Stereum hirsutum FP-91666 SS1]
MHPLGKEPVLCALRVASKSSNHSQLSSLCRGLKEFVNLRGLMAGTGWASSQVTITGDCLGVNRFGMKLRGGSSLE